MDWSLSRKSVTDWASAGSATGRVSFHRSFACSTASVSSRVATSNAVTWRWPKARTVLSRKSTSGRVTSRRTLSDTTNTADLPAVARGLELARPAGALELPLRDVAGVPRPEAPLLRLDLRARGPAPDLVDVIEGAERQEDDGHDRGRLPAHRGGLLGAAADDGDDAAEEHEPGHHDDGEQEHELALVRVEEDGRLLRVLGADRNLILLLREPAHRVQEEVAVALEVQELVGREVRRAVDDDPRLVLPGHGRDRQRALGVGGVGLGHAALQLLAVGLAPALLARPRKRIPAHALGQRGHHGHRAREREERADTAHLAPDRVRPVLLDNRHLRPDAEEPAERVALDDEVVVEHEPVLHEVLPKALVLERVDHDQRLAAAADVAVERVELGLEQIVL